jgi:energy-converting hydrogenase Eha subunit H
MAAAGVVAVNPRAATEAAASIVMLSTTTIEIGEVTQMWNRQFMVWGKVTIQMSIVLHDGPAAPRHIFA